MNRRQSILACAVAALSFPHFLRANESKPFPLTHVKAGEGLSFWVEVYDEADPKKEALKMIQEVNTDEGWIEEFESDGKHLITDGENFKRTRTYGNYALRWRQPTEAEKNQLATRGLDFFGYRRTPRHWNDEQSLNGITIPKGCVHGSSIQDANSLAQMLLKSSFA